MSSPNPVSDDVVGQTIEILPITTQQTLVNMDKLSNAVYYCLVIWGKVNTYTQK